LGADGEALTEILRWDTARAEDAARGLADALGALALFEATGVRVSPKVPLAVWAWLRAEHPVVVRRMARWAGVADLLAVSLTGRLVTDHTLAGRTMAYRLPAPGESLAGSFDAALLGAVGLGPEQLPDVARPDEVAGVLTSPVFAAAGVPLGTPVVVAGHDHAVGAWAAGVREPQDVADSIGTAEAVTTVLPPTWRDRGAIEHARSGDGAVAAAGMSLVRTVTGRHEALVAGSPSAGALLRAWGDALSAAGLDLPPLVPRSAEPTRAVVLPYPHGRRCPYPDPSATLRLIDPAGAEVAWPPVRDTGLWTQAILEGLSLHARWMLEAQSALAGATPSEVVVIGGAQSVTRGWTAVKAAVLPMGVRVVRAAEPVAAGAALLAAHRAGLLSGAAPSLPLSEAPPMPASPGHGSDQASWDALFRHFNALARGDRPQ
jgi:xylulokinase